MFFSEPIIDYFTNQKYNNMIFYFSGCGNSRWVATELGTTLSERVLFIPEELREGGVYEVAENEAIGFVFPIYAWAAPSIVVQFLRKLCFNRTPSYIYVVCTCGDTVGDAIKAFGKAITRRQWHLNAAFSVVMPETYINLKGFELDTPDKEVAKIEAARVSLERIVGAVRDRESVFELSVGSLPWLKTHIVQPIFSAFLISDRPFRVDDSCTHCGRCFDVCPVMNIKMEQGKPTWQGNCVGCMACYHYCPINAIQYGKQTKGKGQYYFGRRK